PTFQSFRPPQPPADAEQAPRAAPRRPPRREEAPTWVATSEETATDETEQLSLEVDPEDDEAVRRRRARRDHDGVREFDPFGER
ncbi:MAG: hypothetical protein ACR2KV_08745, partial [Solirubrobacteraceae bacterium]